MKKVAIKMSGFVKYKSGQLLTIETEAIKRWKEYFGKLHNVHKNDSDMNTV